MKKILSASLLSVLLFTSAGAKSTNAHFDPHIIINEIQISGKNSNDEFIELFNPSDTSVGLEGYKLTKKTKTGSSESVLVSAAKFSGTIQAHGYFLIYHPSYKDEISADLAYSGSTYSISKDNAIFLYDNDEALLDKVGFGAVNKSNSENSPAPNPDASQSIERTNFIDTDDNAADFSISASPTPENSTVVETDDEDDTSDDPEEQRCATTSTNIKLNEIFPYPQSGNEFVEITNAGEDCVDVSGWKMMDKTDHEKAFPENSTIYPGEYLFLEGNLYLNNDSDTVYLLDADGSAKANALDHRYYEEAREGFSFAFDETDWNWTSTPTPEAENVFDSPAIEDSIEASMDNNDKTGVKSSEKVFLNEILPNPKGDEEKNEFIEIVNGDSDPVDLFGWTIRDGSKTGKYVFKEHVEVANGGYLAIYRPDSKITLNNSSESVTLYNPQGGITSSASYDKSTEDASYIFDGKKWKWSKHLTPGKKNRLDSAPKVKIKKPKSVFKDIVADFSASAKDKDTKKLKYSWDFGDGKRSYLAKTTHRYLDTGKYTVTLSVSDDSQTVKKSFALNVKKTPRPDIEITKIIPNPAGNDSDGEVIEIKNNSMKKIDLTGWKIATGSGEKIYNHPISSEFLFNSNEARTITREFSKFSLNNKAGKVVLVSPDGKSIDEVEYSKEKIEDDEAYVKISGEWQWIMPNDDVGADLASTQGETEFVDDPTGEIEAEESIIKEDKEAASGEILGAMDESQSNLSDYKPAFNSENAYIFLSRINFMPSPKQKTNYCPTNNFSSNIAYLIASLI